MGRSFRTAEKDKTEEGVVEPFDYDLDGKMLRVTPPDSTQVMLFSATFGAQDAGDADRIYAAKEFARRVFGKSGYAHIDRRLNDQDDDFDVLDLIAVLQDVVEEIVDNGFPTRPSAASAPSPTTTGPKSTGRAPGKGSTRPTSRRPASST